MNKGQLRGLTSLRRAALAASRKFSTPRSDIEVSITALIEGSAVWIRRYPNAPKFEKLQGQHIHFEAIDMFLQLPEKEEPLRGSQKGTAS